MSSNRLCGGVAEARGASLEVQKLSLRACAAGPSQELSVVLKQRRLRRGRQELVVGGWRTVCQLSPSPPHQHSVAPGAVIKEKKCPPSCRAVAGALLRYTSPLQGCPEQESEWGRGAEEDIWEEQMGVKIC